MKLHLLVLMLILFSSPVHAEWTQQDSGTTADLVDVCFVDELHGWAIGNEDDGSPVIIATTDGGVTWVQQECPSESAVLTKVCFINDQVGFITSRAYFQGDIYNSCIYSTSNGGVVWEISYVAPYYYKFHDITFVNEQTLWVAGGVYGDTSENEPSGGVIVTTSDAGLTWDSQLFTTPGDYDRIDAFKAIAFADSDTGWALGDYSEFTIGDIPSMNIYHTSDSGENWNIISQLPMSAHSLHVVSPFEILTSAGGVNYSEDGGATWIERSGMFIQDLSIVTDNKMWGIDSSTVFFTENEGISWSEQFEDETQTHIAIDCINDSFVCVVGHNGSVTTYNTIPSFVEVPSQPDIFTLEPNYPNPFNASTTIPYTLNENSIVTCQIYSTTGQLVQTLNKQYLPTGRYYGVFDGRDLASGLYIARIEAQGVAKYVRMLLVK